MADDPRTRHIAYRCSACGASKDRDSLFVKRVYFATMGVKYKILKSRTVAWLCESCRDADPHWTQEFSQSPGFKKGES